MLSDSNARLAAARRLTMRRGRGEAGLFLAEGAQAVREALKASAVVELFATAAAIDRHADLWSSAMDAGLRADEISEKAAAALSETVTPQGLVAVCRIPSESLATLAVASPKLVAVLVEPNDPGNLGTVIRSADAAGADAVILVGDAVDPFGGKVVRASVGSIFHLPVICGVDWTLLVDGLRGAGLQLLATTGAASEDLPALAADGRLAQPTAWIFGTEAHGLPDAVIAECDQAVRVPIYGQAESLNLAVAAALCLYASAQQHAAR